MKKVLLIAGCLLASLGAYAQGTIDVTISPSGVNAPVFDFGGAKLDSTFLAQFYFSSSANGPFTAVADNPVPFRSGAGAGYWNAVGSVSGDSSRTLTGIAAGSAAFVEVKAWNLSAGATYDIANKVGGAHTGVSQVVSIPATGGAGSPPGLPAALTGLQSFTLSVVPVPEPSTLALGLVGAAALFLRRRK